MAELVKIKWNKAVFDFEFIPAQGVSEFKRKVQDLTGVPVERQKLMAKGLWNGTLRDDADISKIKIEKNHQILLMGTADVVAAPKEAPKFVEDMTNEEKAVGGVTLPAGFENLGNTCYMNSTLQCIRHMPELRESLNLQNIANAALSRIFKESLNNIDKSATKFYPHAFWSALKRDYPQFAQTDSHGHFMQQDSEEFYNALLASLTRDGEVNTNKNSPLNIPMEEKLICQESDSEPILTKSILINNKLTVNIQGGPGTQPVDHIQEGINLALNGTVEKYSSNLNRDAIWNKSLKIAGLPQYLCFHFMRFFWKATPENRDHAGVKCKILRAVNYPETLDVFDFCTDSLKELLRHNRQEEAKEFDKKMKLNSSISSSTIPSAIEEIVSVDQIIAPSAAMEVDDSEDAVALAEALKMSTGSVNVVQATSTSNPLLPHPSFTGLYELHSLVTHKGRSADSGHYIGWVRQSPGADRWWKYDDAAVQEVGMEDIMLLRGGGDRDMAYMAFYRFKLPKH